MKTHVIILAQGSQSRLPELPVAKQLLTLSACDDIPIMYRTVRQIEAICPHAYVEIVTWSEVARRLVSDGFLGPFIYEGRHRRVITTLSDPGNSSLRGFAKTLGDPLLARNRPDQTVCLLGDVVYSWDCLRAIVGTDRIRFVGTSDLSNSGGELWGFSWTYHANAQIKDALEHALERHPKFDAYQPGQMRRLLWALRCDETPLPPFYRAIDDYTRDIDLPEHLDLLVELSRAARADDEKNGVIWP